MVRKPFLEPFSLLRRRHNADSPRKLERFQSAGRYPHVRTALVIAIGATVACGGSNKTDTPPPASPPPEKKATVSSAAFGELPNRSSVTIYTLTNANGVEVRTIPYGAIIVSVRVPDKAGRVDDVVLGFDRLDGYLGTHPYFGAIVGRYANRIAKGSFALDGQTYSLATNNGPNALHGGLKGFDKKMWTAELADNEGNVSVIYRVESPDGDEGYPGNVKVQVTYTLTRNNELSVEYEASTDKATPINLSQHSYFNLAGEGRGDIRGHRLTIDADRFTPVDATLIPTGDQASVENTPFDFRRPTVVGARIDADEEQLRHGGGYDHNWVLNRDRDGLIHAARLEEPTSGRTLDVSTTEPGLQFYAGNFLDGTIKGKSGRVYAKRSGLCLETQHFPDSPNHAGFPSTILRPGERFRSKTVFAFGVNK
jgi:aldose 1-epimerase